MQRRCAALGVITRMLPRIRAACKKCREDRRLRALAVAVVPIQAAVRGRRQRRLLQRQHQAAATIQAHFRGKLVRAATSHEVRPAALLMPVQVDFFLVQCSQFTLTSAFAHAVPVWGTGRCPMKLAISRGPKQKQQIPTPRTPSLCGSGASVGVNVPCMKQPTKQLDISPCSCACFIVLATMCWCSLSRPPPSLPSFHR